jgi:Prenyltransferase and squalene oxidase repeat
VAPRPPRSGSRPHPAIATGLVAALGLVLPAAAQAGPLSRALDNLAAHQDRFGGGFSAGSGTDPNDTAWAILAVTAAGESADHWRSGHASLRDAMARPLRKPMLGDIARTAVAASAAGLDPRRVGGRNLMRDVLAAQNADGSIGDGPSTTAWGILALRAGGLSPSSFSVRRARGALERRQREDGGWSADASPLGRDPNTTSVAIQALVAAGRRPDHAISLRRARDFLRRAQNPDGGFPAVVGGESTALTTAWVTVALRTLGDRPDRAPWNRAGGPVRLLRRLQLPDGGVRNSQESAAPSVWATSQAALAFAPGPLPLWPRGGRQTPPRTPKAVLREPRGGGLVVRYRDDQGGTGVDPASVHVRVGGRDVTDEARVTSRILKLPRRGVPAGRSTVALTIADRAGNARSVLWEVPSRRDR